MTYQYEEPVYTTKFKDYEQSTLELLQKLNLKEHLKGQKKIIIKPNLVSCAPPPVTTDVGLVEALCRYCLEHSDARVIVAEGPAGCDAVESFEKLRFFERLKPLGIDLVDLDSEEEIVKLQNRNLPLFKEVLLPKIITDGFLISAAVLKDHTFCTTTLSIKNLIGILPAKHYKGWWRFRKSKAHRHNIHQAAADVATYRPINLAIIDGAIGLKKGHLFGGRPCSPPKNILVGSYDPLAADIEGAKILGHNFLKVKHLRCYFNNIKQNKAKVTAQP